MLIPTTIDGHPVLGYLIATRIADVYLPIDKYNEVVDDVVVRYGPKLAVLRAAENRNAKDILSNALKTFVSKYADGAAGYRYLVRKDGKKSEWHLIRERVAADAVAADADPEYKAFAYGDIGSVSTERSSLITRSAYVGARADEQPFDEIRALYAAHSTQFPASGVKCKLAALVRDTVPLGYDPEHIFQFILAEHADVLRGAHAVVDAIRSISGSNTGMSVLGLPDIDYMRGHMVERCVAEVEDAVARVGDKIKGVGSMEASAVAHAVETLQNATMLAMTYRTKFGAAVLSMENQLSALRVKLAQMMAPNIGRSEKTLHVRREEGFTTQVQQVAHALYEDSHMPVALAQVLQYPNTVFQQPNIVGSCEMRLQTVGRADEVYTLQLLVDDMPRADILTIKADSKFGAYTIVFNGELPVPGDLPVESSPVGKTLRIRVDDNVGVYNHPALGIIGEHIERWFRSWLLSLSKANA